METELAEITEVDGKKYGETARILWYNTREVYLSGNDHSFNKWRCGMPKFMKDAAIAILDGAIETYILALYGKNIPTIRSLHKPETKFAPVFGLLGSCVELLVKACLVQAKGISAMYNEGDTLKGSYLFAADALKELKGEIKNNSPCVSFLWKDPNDNDEIRGQTINYLNKFVLLLKNRADGLHAGLGCSNDVCSAAFCDVYDFISILSQGKRLKAYLKNIPAPEVPVRDREAIIEDLNRRLVASKDVNTKIGYLRNMYLVLPYVPEIEPEWVSILDHINVATPTNDDLSYLTKTLSQARSIHLLKARGGNEGVPARINQNDENALSIAVQYLKRELKTMPDKFQNDVLSANTRLAEKRLDLPVEDFIVDLFNVGILNANVILDGNKLTAQQVWPFVASAISSEGCPRPCFFIIRECDELNKLVAYLQQITPFANGYFRRRVDTVIACIKAIMNVTEMRYRSAKDRVYRDILEFKNTPMRYGSDVFPIDFIRKHKLKEGENGIIQAFISNEIDAGTALQSILSIEEFGEIEKKYAIQLLKLCRTSKEKSGLVAVLNSPHLKTYRSDARKRMFCIDMIENGPYIYEN